MLADPEVQVAAAPILFAEVTGALEREARQREREERQSLNNRRLGLLVFQSISQRDVAVIQAGVLVSAPNTVVIEGHTDFYGSDDVEDVLTLVDGRPELLLELRSSARPVRDYVSKSIRQLLSNREFLNALPGHLDIGRDTVVLDRLRAIEALDQGAQ